MRLAAPLRLELGDVIQKDRRLSPRKIDAAVAAIIALDRANYHRTAKPKRSGLVWTA